MHHCIDIFRVRQRIHYTINFKTPDLFLSFLLRIALHVHRIYSPKTTIASLMHKRIVLF